MDFDIDIAIFLSYLVINLIVGLKYGRNVKSIDDYALGGRNFTTGALVATIVGTWASGSGFFITLSKVYSDGIYYVIASSFLVAPLLFIAYVFAPRMGEFLGKISMAEAMGEFYGKHVRIIVAIAGISGGLGIVAMQFKVVGNVFHQFLNIYEIMAVVSAGTIVTIYSVFGGIRAITFTDILQCVTFGVAVPLVGLVIWSQLQLTPGGFDLSLALRNPQFNITEVFDFGNAKFYEMIPLLLFFLVPAINPTDSQRIMMGSSIKQVKKAFIISAILLECIKLSMSWIPFLLFNVDPTLDHNNLLPYILNNYTYAGIKCLLMIAIVALAMSTADAFMNISSVMFAHDICKPLNIAINNELMVSRVFTTFLGILATMLAISNSDLLNIVLSAHSFHMPIVTVPLICTILGFRSSSKSVLIGMGAGLITVITWKILGIKMDCIVVAMCVNCLFLFSSHYFLRQPGGWVGIKDKTFLNQELQEKQRAKALRDKRNRDFTILNFIKNLAPKNELMYSGFGIYCIICTFVTMYITDSELTKEHSRVIMHFYQMMLVTGTMMGSFPIWPASIKKEIIVQVWWPFAVFYILGFFSAFFLMVTHFEGLGCAVFTINAMVALIIAGWKFGALIISIGLGLASIAYQAYTGTTDIGLTEVYSTTSILMYIFLLLGAATIIFLKPKEIEHELSEFKVDYLNDIVDFHKKEIAQLHEMKQEFLRNIEHESRTPITGIGSMGETLYKGYDKFSDEQRKSAAREIAYSTERLNSWASNLTNLAKLVADGMQDFKRENVNLSELLNERLESCRKIYISEQDADKRAFEANLGGDITVNCDRYYITRVLDNLIINAIQYCKRGKIELTLTQRLQDKDIEFSISDEGIGIPQADLVDIFGLLTTSAKTKSSAGGRGVGLALCKKVLELHGGKIWAESDGAKGSRFVFVL